MFFNMLFEFYEKLQNFLLYKVYFKLMLQMENDEYLLPE